MRRSATSKIPLTTAGALFAMVGMASRASAQTSEPVRIEVEAPTECASDVSFFDAVRGRTPRIRLATSTEAPVHIIRVRLRPETSARLTTGELVLLDAKGGATHRRLTGETCAVVVSGLAWVAARAIDPEASFAPTRPTPPTPSPAPAPALAPVPALLPAPTPSSVPARAPARRVSTELHEAGHEETPRPGWRLMVGAEAATLKLGSLGLVPDVAAFADLALDTHKTLAPSVRLAFHHTPQDQTSVNDIVAEFTWTFVRADLCPWRFAPARTLSFRPCALLDGGALAARGGTSGAGLLAASHVSTWFAAGALGRVDWTLLDPISLEVDGGALFPFTRDDFENQPGVTVYEAPGAVPFVSLGFAGRFP